MSSFIPCRPNVSCFPSPEIDVDALLENLSQRVEHEKSRVSLQLVQSNDGNSSQISKDCIMPTDWETSTPSLLRILKMGKYEVEAAYVLWLEWIKWRRSYEIDDIDEEYIRSDKESGIAQWRGKDKLGRPCLVLTGRMLDPINRTGTMKSFLKFVLHTSEHGVQLIENSDLKEVCIVYDRRGLGFEHIDPNLFMCTRQAVQGLRKWYGIHIGVIYVLYTNVLFWTLYHVILRPILGILSSGNKFVVCDKNEDLLQYFYEEDLLLTSPSVSAASCRADELRRLHSDTIHGEDGIKFDSIQGEDSSSDENLQSSARLLGRVSDQESTGAISSPFFEMRR